MEKRLKNYSLVTQRKPVIHFCFGKFLTGGDWGTISFTEELRQKGLSTISKCISVKVQPRFSKWSISQILVL